MYELMIHSKIYSTGAMFMYLIGVLLPIACVIAAFSGDLAGVVCMPLTILAFKAGKYMEKKHDEVIEMINEIKKG